MNLYKSLKNNNIIENKHCVLRSEKHSNIYIRKTKITTIPHLYSLVMEKLTTAIFDKFKLNEYDIITGPAVTGVCFAAPLALALEKPFIFPEKDFSDDINKTISKEHKMTFRKEFLEILCEGKDPYDYERKKVVIIEDVITTGGSVIKTAQSILKTGGYVIAAFCIWNRNPKMRYIKLGESAICKFPIYSLISKKINDWTREECPICNK